MAQALTGKLASLNPFSRSRKHDDDRGEEIDVGTIGGGGHGARASDITKHDLHTSRAQKAFLVDREVLSEDEAGLEQADPTAALLAILEQPHAILPAELTDRSFRLPEYFISSSHNTYLQAHQLYGSSAADSYSIALSTGSRCVEIDAWDDDDNAEEPKVTHGYTLVSHISLRAVCETIRDVIDKEAANAETDPSSRPSPIVISLENHCTAHGQLRIAEIMTEVLGDRLLAQPLESSDPEEHVTLAELGAKVIVMVEHHIPGEQEDSDTSDDSSDSSDSSEDEDDEKEKREHEEYKAKKKAANTKVIIPELAALGVYAQSVKPSNNSWFDPGELIDRPHHHLINVSESGLSAHLPAQRAAIARHNSRHLMRVFPKGTRISSRNLHPAPFWAVGAQVSALNWQRFDATMQLNEALFQGSDGYVLKPAALRAGGSYDLSTGQRVKLRLHVAGAAGIPIAEDRELDSVRPYLTCSLVHPDDLGSPPSERKQKTKVYKRGDLKALGALGALISGGDEGPPPTDPLWDEVLEWEYEDNELVFLRLLIKNDENWSSNLKFVVAAVRLSYVQPGWKFIRMLDLKGRETKCSLLVKFEVTKV